MATWSTVTSIGRELPGTEESTSYRTPALKVAGKLFARLLEDGRCIVVRTSLEERETLLEAAPESFLVTPHYENHPMIVVRLAKVPRALLRQVVVEAWRRVAPKKRIAELDQEAAVKKGLVRR